MDRTLKIALLIAGGVIVLGGISFAVYHFFLKDDKPTDESKGGDTTGKQQSSAGSSGSTTTPKPDPVPTDPNLVSPKFNAEGELINPFSELSGRMLYPKRKSIGGWDYANIRATMEVNTDRGWWDFSDNLLTTINAGTPIGTVVAAEAKEYNGYAYRWFKVKLYKTVWTFWGGTLYYGFVRADTVTIKPYER